MKANADFALGVVVAATGIAFLWAAQRLWTARSELDLVREQDVRSAKLIAEVRHLRALPTIIEDSPIKEDRILGLVSDCLSQSGINPSAIRDVSSESQAGGTANYRRQNIRVQLDSLGVPEMGRFLVTWNKLHPTWTPTTINLSPNSKADSASKSNDSVSWSATVVFTSTYLANQSPNLAGEEIAPAPKPVPARRGTLPAVKPAR